MIYVVISGAAINILSGPLKSLLLALMLSLHCP